MRFRRQHPIGPCVVDFYRPDLKLAIEVDGAAYDHPDRANRDRIRDLWLMKQNIIVLGFPARDLLTEDGRQSVLDTIAARLDAPSTTLRAVPLSREAGEDEIARRLHRRVSAKGNARITGVPDRARPRAA